MLLNGTDSAAAAGVVSIGTDASPEEALAGFAALHTKVVARGNVATDSAYGLLLQDVIGSLLGVYTLAGLRIVIAKHVITEGPIGDCIAIGVWGLLGRKELLLLIAEWLLLLCG